MNKNRPTLTQLADKYGSDKGTLGPSEAWGGLNYTDVYSAYLDPIQDHEIRILEIGIGATGDRWDSRIVHGRNHGGASIRMWYDYFPQAQITAIDINPAKYLDNERTATYLVDQSNEEELKEFINNQDPFDLIIDDGSHHPAHQQLSLSLLFPHLNSGGLYIIEDLDANGLGDNGKDIRTFDRTIYNTRTVLKHLITTGQVKAPNNFRDDHFLKEIKDMSFHCPEPVVQTHWRLIPPKRRYSIQYRQGSERVCIIRKK